MNKRKKIIYFLLFFVVLFIYTNKVDAVYNGNAGTAFSGGYSGRCNKYQKNCLVNTYDGIALQARIYYIQNGSFSQVGKTYYFVNKPFRGAIGRGQVNLIVLDNLDYTNYMDSISYIKENYLKNNYVDFFKKMLGNNYNEYLQKVTNVSSGYRLIIEPAYLYSNPTFGNGETHALMTKKGFIAEALRNKLNMNINNNQNKNDYYYQNIDDTVYYMEKAELLITPVNKTTCEDAKPYLLADMTYACGYYMIDISDYIKKEDCYKSSIKTDKKLNCTNYDMNNIGKYSEKYETTSCENLSNNEKKRVTKYGTLLVSNDTCNLYCKETAMVSFPGNISTSKLRGSYFAWPTRPNDSNGLYKMSMKSEYECKIVDEVSETNVASVLYTDCPEEYKVGEKCISLTDTASKICKGPKTEVNGKCYSIVDSTPSYSCSDGSNPNSNNECPVTTYSCKTGLIDIGDGYCYKYLGSWYGKTCTNAGGSGVNVAVCRKAGDEATYSFCCGIRYNKTASTTYVPAIAGEPTCPSGYSLYSGDSSKCISNESTPMSCPNNYTDCSNGCCKKKEKTKLNYFCPEEYMISEDKTTCTKSACNKDNLISKFKTEYFEKNNMSASLSGGTNNNIPSRVLDKITITNFDETNLKFTKITEFKIPENINRYYNPLTDTVSNSYKKGIFDRKEGVISLSKNDNIYINGIIKKYELKISNIKLGSNNKFGNEINDYKCYYKITDNSSCTCPNGTKNEGILVEDLVEKIYAGSKSFDEKTCLDWQYNLCDSDSSYVNNYYCINTTNGNKEEITNCVKNKKNVSLMTAITECTEANNKCTNDYCYSEKSKSSVSIKTCLNEGNSRKSCMKKAGCLDSGKICSGNCESKETSINNVTYTLQVCEKNQYCNFEVQCKNNDTSKSSETCVKSKLGVNNIEDSLTNGTISLDRLKAAVSSCQKTICASDSKIIFRVIDLEEPFPGKSNSNKTGFSLNGSKSRNPGYNWNSKEVVKQEILNSRGKNGYEVYSKTPLLKITLTPDTIRKIKNYNKQKKYDDFNLKCVGSNNTDCISSFLHTNTDIIKIEGVQNCTKLNLSSTSNDFKKCYNSNN